MPTYDFKCESCDKIDEYIVPTSTSIPSKCSCGKEDCKLVKVESFSSSRPHLKGSGFHQTDYKNKG